MSAKTRGAKSTGRMETEARMDLKETMVADSGARNGGGGGEGAGREAGERRGPIYAEWKSGRGG